MTRPIMLAVLVIAVGTVASCTDDSASEPTALRIRPRFETTWQLTQLEINALDREAVVPDAPTELSSDTSVVVLVDDGDDRPRDVGVWGLRDGERVAWGQAEAVPVRSEVVEVPVVLALLPCGAWCIEGTTSCGGDGVRTCAQRDDDSCMEWSESEPCPTSAPYCSLGRCGATCVDECAAGESRCAGSGRVQQCGQSDSDGCFDWLPPVMCGDGATCESGVCKSGRCSDECAAGESRCAGAGSSDCGQFDTDDCLEFGPEQPCPDGETCSGGTCAETCTDDCQASACNGLSWRQCGQFDLDPCRDLSPGTSCQPSDACLEGACDASSGCDTAPLICDVPPESYCIDSGTWRAYQAQGTCSDGVCDYSYVDTPCPQCPACDACANVTCDAPPAPVACYESTGSCAAGACTYAYDDEAGCDDGDACTVGDGCASGACVGTPKMCTTPPLAGCVDASTLRSYFSPGTCGGGGQCSYPFSDETCAAGCQNGACDAPTCDSIVVVEGQDNVGAFSSIAVGPTGAVHVAYYDATDDDVMYATDVGGSFLVDEVDQLGNVGWFTSLAMDAAGGAHLSYLDVSDNERLIYAHRPAGGTWTRLGIDAPTETSSLALDASGGVHIAYYDLLTYNLRYAHKPMGGTWSYETIDASFLAGWENSIVVDASGGVHVAHYNLDTYDAVYAYKPSGGTWSSVPIDTVGDVGLYIDLAVDAVGGVHVSYYDDTAGDLRYAYRPTGGAFSSTTLVSGGDVGQHTSIAIDVLGGVHIVYYDNTNGDLERAHKPSGGSWSYAPVDANGDVGASASLAIDGMVLHVSYRDSTAGDLKYARICP